MFESSKKKFIANWPIFLLAFIIGFLIIMPTVSSILKIGSSSFRGIYPVFNDDEDYYTARVSDVFHGHLLGNPFIREHSADYSVQPPLAEVIFAFVAKFFGLSVPAVFVLADFLLPFIGVIVLYVLIYDLTKSQKTGYIFAALFYFLFLFSFGRPIHPQFSFIFFVLGLIFIWRIASCENFKGAAFWHVLLATDFAFLVYLYPYYWTAIVVVYGLVVFFNILTRKNFYAQARNFGFFVAIAGLLSLPYLFNLLESPTLIYKQAILRLGLLTIHWPACYLNVALLIMAGFWLFLMKDRISRQKFNFCLSLIIGGIVLNWQNMITGKYLQFSSHYYPVTVFFVLLVLVLLFQALWSRGFGDRRSKIIFFGIFVIFAAIFYKQIGDTRQWLGAVGGLERGKMLEIQKMADVYSWFNRNTMPGSVVYNMSGLPGFLPIYTANYLYSYGYAGAFLIEDNELEDRWVRQNLFDNKVDADYVLAHQREIWLNKFIDRYQNESVRRKIISNLTGKKETEPILVPPEYINRVLQKYKEVKKEDLRSALKKYEINYILLDPNDSDYRDSEVELKKYEFIQPLEKINNHIIYRVN